MLTGAARFALPRVYVPNSDSNTVDVIDPKTFRVIGHFAVGALPQHVTPSWNLRTLYVDNDRGNSLTPIDPRTGRPTGRTLAVPDPYNLYFTPDGRSAIVVAERLQRLDFRNPDVPPAAVAGGSMPRRRPHGLHGRRLLRSRAVSSRSARRGCTGRGGRRHRGAATRATPQDVGSATGSFSTSLT
jgi:YVTN family beta-propeller protein